MMADPLLAQSAVDRLVSTAHELVIAGAEIRPGAPRPGGRLAGAPTRPTVLLERMF